jgi:hypothetical protein
MLWRFWPLRTNSFADAPACRGVRLNSLSLFSLPPTPTATQVATAPRPSQISTLLLLLLLLLLLPCAALPSWRGLASLAGSAALPQPSLGLLSGLLASVLCPNHTRRSGLFPCSTRPTPRPALPRLASLRLARPHPIQPSSLRSVIPTRPPPRSPVQPPSASFRPRRNHNHLRPRSLRQNLRGRRVFASLVLLARGPRPFSHSTQRCKPCESLTPHFLRSHGQDASVESRTIERSASVSYESL